MKKRLLYLLYALFFLMPATLLAQTANHVVISEVFGGGGNGTGATAAPYANDFIELYNPTATAIDISGWSVQYASATGSSAISASNQTIIPASTTIKAHGYFLIQESAGANTSAAALPSPDINNGTIAISGTTGKVFLVNNSTLLSVPTGGATVVDFIGWGPTATPSEGSSPAPVTSNTTSVERKASATSTAATMASGGTEDLKGNGWDSDNNGNDFFIPVTINPQSSSSPIEPALTVSPSLTVTTTPASSPSAIDFGTTQTTNTSSTAQTFTLSGANLTTDASLSVTGPYTFSTNNGVSYVTSATILQATLSSAQSVLVKFNPIVVGAAPGTLTITSGTATATIALTGTAVAPAAPALTTSVSSLDFGTTQTTGTSTTKTFTLSGTNLTAGASLAVSGTAYTISTDGITFGPNATIASAFTSAQTITVKFTPPNTLPANPTAANETITISSSGASNQLVTLTGTGVNPTLTPSTGTVGFGNATIGTTTNPQSFTIAGNNLTGAVNVTVIIPTSPPVSPTTFQVSTDNGTTWTTTGLITSFVSPQTILVRYTPAVLGASTGFSISISSSGATTKTVTLSGTGVAAPVPALTLAPTSLTFSGLVGSTSAAQSYTITGANITGASSVTVAAPYTVSKTQAGVYSGSLSYIPSDFSSGPQTVWVKFSPTVVATGGVNSTSITNGTAGGTNQSLTLNGTGIGVPLLTPSTSSLTFSQVVNTTSAAQNFTITGIYLTANTTVTATGPYSISKTSSGTYVTNLTYSTAELAAPVTLYVQFSPTVIAAGGVNNGSLTLASNGAANQIVTLNGEGLAVPVLTITPGTTIAFGNQSIAVASAPKSFSLSGANITANTTVSTTAPYGVSKDGLTFSTSIFYTPTEIAATPTVYVNFNPTVVASTYPATVTVASGTVSQTVTLTGAGIPPPNVAPTFAAIANQAVCYTTAVQTIPITGISPTEPAQAITSISVTSSNPALFSQLGVVPLVTGATATQINYAIAAGASGTAVITVTVKDNGGVLNGGIDTYTSTFNITVNPLAVVSITASSNPVEKGQTVTLTATGGVTYAWTVPTSNSNDIIGPTNGASIVVRPGTLTGTPLAPSKTPVTYTVTAYNATGCPTVQTYTVNTFNSQKLVVSNIVTPNGDGINDTWVILNIELYPTNTVKIFDKAGKIVFAQSGYLNTWNGYGTDGSPLTQGTYYYVIDLGSGSKYSGFISLVRN